MKSSVPALACLLFVPVAIAPSWAQSGDDELVEVERRLKNSAEEEKRLRLEAAEREKEVAALRHRLIETADSLQKAERQTTQLEGSIASLEREKTQAEAALAGKRAHLSDVLAALQSLELSRPPALLVSPEDANDAARAAMMLSDAAPQLQGRATRLKDAIDTLNAVQTSLLAEQDAFKTANRELKARRNVLSELMARKEKERDVAARLASAAQRETARLAARATSLREVVQRLERLAHSVTPRIKPAPRTIAAPVVTASIPVTPTIRRQKPSRYVAKRPFSQARGALRAPVTGRLIGAYGSQRPEGGPYEGVRFQTPNQAIVTAPFEGRVVFARDWGLAGNMIVLDVGGGYHILLIGLDRILVEESQQISAGEPIARMAAENATLDLEVRKNGEPVNPSLWLSEDSKKKLAF